MKTFRVIDFETTGLGPNSGIVEIGVTDLIWEGKSMEVSDTKSWLTNPGRSSEIGALAIHHITDAMVQGCPHPDLILQELENGADYIVAHNLRFEEQFFTPNLPTICTLKCARSLVPEAPGHKNQELRYFLETNADPIRAEPPHRAGPDTYVTALILRALLVRSVKEGGDFVGRLVNLTNSARLLRTIHFGKYKGMTFEEVAYSDRGYLNWIVNSDKAEADVRNTAKHWLERTK